MTAAQRATIKRAQSAHLKGVPVGKKAIITGSGIKYVDRTDYVPELDAPDEFGRTYILYSVGIDGKDDGGAELARAGELERYPLCCSRGLRAAAAGRR